MSCGLKFIDTSFIWKRFSNKNWLSSGNDPPKKYLINDKIMVFEKKRTTKNATITTNFGNCVVFGEVGSKTVEVFALDLSSNLGNITYLSIMRGL